MRAFMVNMAWLEQRDQQIDIEQRTHVLDIFSEPFFDHFGCNDLAGPWQQWNAVAILHLSGWRRTRQRLPYKV